jgi:hypothetical protein
MRRKLLMLVAPIVLVLASLASPAFALHNCSCAYCARVGPDQICNDTAAGTTTFCVNYSTANCP